MCALRFELGSIESSQDGWVSGDRVSVGWVGGGLRWGGGVGEVGVSERAHKVNMYIYYFLAPPPPRPPPPPTPPKKKVFKKLKCLFIDAQGKSVGPSPTARVLFYWCIRPSKRKLAVSITKAQVLRSGMSSVEGRREWGVRNCTRITPLSL